MEAASDRRKKLVRGFLIGGAFSVVDLFFSLIVYRLVVKAEGQPWSFVEYVLGKACGEVIRLHAFPFLLSLRPVWYYVFYGFLFLAWGFACGFFGWAFSKRSVYLTLARSAGLYIALCSVISVVGFLVASTGGL